MCLRTCTQCALYTACFVAPDSLWMSIARSQDERLLSLILYTTRSRDIRQVGRWMALLMQGKHRDETKSEL